MKSLSLITMILFPAEYDLDMHPVLELRTCDAFYPVLSLCMLHNTQSLISALSKQRIREQ